MAEGLEAAFGALSLLSRAGMRYAVFMALLTGPAALAGPTGDQTLTVSQQRLLDGAYLYLVSPRYCRPALPADRLRDWITTLIGQRGLTREAAFAYLARQEPRLDQIARTAFTGRKGKDLCRSIYQLRDTVPELRNEKNAPE